MSRPDSELAHLFRQLKAPAAARALPKVADRARQEQWSYEHFAATLLKTETDSRDSHGGQARIKAARFPARKTLEEFDFAFQTRSPQRGPAPRPARLPRRQGERRPVGPARDRQDAPLDRLGIRACLAGHRVAFRTATEWVALLADAQRQGRLDDELARLQRIPLLIVDEVGYIPFDPQAANLMFMLVSRRYERASLIVTSNKPFAAWGEIFGDEVAAAAMIDRLVHHAEILALKGDTYRLKDRDLARPPAARSPKRPDRSPSGLARAPQNAFTRLKLEHERPKPPKRNSQASPARARPGFADPASDTEQQQSGPLFNRHEWPGFQPALTPRREPHQRNWSRAGGGDLIRENVGKPARTHGETGREPRIATQLD